MIVIGIDPHKATHTAAAVASQTGELRGELTVSARERGHEELVAWARGLGEDRLFALEDCRHVSGRVERFLIGSGERVVRVPPKLMGKTRKAARRFGKSDAIDALAVARAALREPDLPAARLASAELEAKLLLDHREDLVAEATRINNRLRWHLHELDPELEIARGRLDRTAWMERLARRLARLGEGVRARICRHQLRRLKGLAREIKATEAELGGLVRAEAPALLELPGCGTLTAAKLLAEVAGVERFSSDAKLAMLAGVAPLDASSGRQRRHRLNRRGNRQLNLALHRIAATQARVHAPARAYLERKRAEGKGRREALRCLKRHLARVVFKLLRAIARHRHRVDKLPLENERKIVEMPGQISEPALT
ncbi:MAG TPA: IS110 family transposase [Thermoleophilaceae bacterium]|jgi:transposase|nr:IS110 family transposase [Thermoleophilaceae bacterium]